LIGLTFHVISIFTSAGYTAVQALKIFLPISAVSVASQFIGSWLSDRINLKYIVLALSAAMIAAASALSLLGSSFSVLLLIIGIGISMGLFNILNIIGWPKLFGTAHVGAVSGFGMAFIVAGSAIGPWIFSLLFRFTGAYRAAGLFGLCFSFAAGLLTLLWKDTR